MWWPHTEALYSLLLAYHLSREEWCLHWYERVHGYAWMHYPVPVHGEWTQRLDRRGNKLNETVALPVKDPFHLPRALIYCIEGVEQTVTVASRHEGYHHRPESTPLSGRFCNSSRQRQHKGNQVAQLLFGELRGRAMLIGGVCAP